VGRTSGDEVFIGLSSPFLEGKSSTSGPGEHGEELKPGSMQGHEDVAAGRTSQRDCSSFRKMEVEDRGLG